MLLAVVHTAQQGFNRATLIALRFVIRDEFKVDGISSFFGS